MTAQKLEKAISEFLQYKSEMEEIGRGCDLHGFCDLFVKQDKDIIEAELFQVEFEENWISFQLTKEQMKDGFHAGYATIDLTGIR